MNDYAWFQECRNGHDVLSRFSGRDVKPHDWEAPSTDCPLCGTPLSVHFWQRDDDA